MEYELRETNWAVAKTDSISIRTKVFEKDLIKKIECKNDERDPYCWHVNAYEIKTQNAVATARIDTDGRIDYLAVLDSHRKKGIGTLLLEKLKHIARREQILKTYLSINDNVTFFKQRGYQYIDTNNHASIEQQDTPYVQHLIEVLDIEHLTFTDAVKAINLNIQESEYSLKIKVKDINHALFCHAETVAAIRSKAIKSDRYSIQILIEKSRTSKRSSDFVRAYQRLTDKIQIKTYHPPPIEPDHRQFILLDRGVVIQQPNVDSLNMQFIRVKYRIKKFNDDFDFLFNRSERDLNLLRLYL